MKKLYIEIADTPEKRERGLMHRKMMNNDDAMLFRFSTPSYLSFWMRNTYIPLDVAFLKDDGKILQIEAMVPLSTRAVRSNHLCRYALEVNHGWFKNNDIKVGSYVGGEGIYHIKNKISQAVQLDQLGAPAETIPGQQESEVPNPDVMLNISNKDKLKRAELKGNDMIVIYQTKGGVTLPPKVISPPFRFEKDADGRHDAIVKAWDNQTGGWKSFIIDNIISLEDKK